MNDYYVRKLAFCYIENGTYKTRAAKTNMFRSHPFKNEPGIPQRELLLSREKLINFLSNALNPLLAGEKINEAARDEVIVDLPVLCGLDDLQ
jgi:hypothetical protein